MNDKPVTLECLQCDFCSFHIQDAPFLAQLKPFATISPTSYDVKPTSTSLLTPPSRSPTSQITQNRPVVPSHNNTVISNPIPNLTYPVTERNRPSIRRVDDEPPTQEVSDVLKIGLEGRKQDSSIRTDALRYLTMILPNTWQFRPSDYNWELDFSNYLPDGTTQGINSSSPSFSQNNRTKETDSPSSFVLKITLQFYENGNGGWTPLTSIPTSDYIEVKSQQSKHYTSPLSPYLQFKNRQTVLCLKFKKMIGENWGLGVTLHSSTALQSSEKVAISSEILPLIKHKGKKRMLKNDDTERKGNKKRKKGESRESV